MNVGNFSVSNWIFAGGRSLPVHELSSSAPTPVFAGLRGHFALDLQADGAHLLARDPLGVNKLFFAAGDGWLESSNFFIDLVRRGHAPERIWSVPSGHVLRAWPNERRLSLEKYSTLSFDDETKDLESVLPAHADRIRTALSATFRELRAALPESTPLYVTLSGGLDSTTIAALAREHLGRFTAVTFVARDPGVGDDPDSDLHYARLVAESFGIPLEVIEITPDALLERLDEVLVYGQDFRDFNVHCGLVNAVLARAIAERERARTPGGGSNGGPSAVRPCVLTGDTMNELVADYTPVQYGASEYYSLPNLSRGRLRRFLVSGLDSGDREVGIYARHGIDVLQPYAIRPDVYTALPGNFLEDDDAKQRLARLVMGERVPAAIYSRKKVRAQVAGSEKVGGTMKALLDRGVDGAALQRRFCELMGFDAPELKRWMRAGVYRFPSSYPEVRENE